jgi:hypothetical protein
LYVWDGSVAPPRRITLSAAGNGYCHVVPAGMWQAAEPIDDTVLVGCSVAPGFEFSDFQLMAADSADAKRLIAASPELAAKLLSY